MTVTVTKLSPFVEKWVIDYYTNDRVAEKVKNYKDYGFDTPVKACKEQLCWSGFAYGIGENIKTREEISVWGDAMPDGIFIKENPNTEKEIKAKIKYKRIVDEILNKTLF